MLETILIGAGCLLAGTLVGYMSRKPKRQFNRCEALTKMASGPKENRSIHTVRCELELFHSGPHLHTIESRYDNAGEQYWWGNEDSSLANIIKD